VSLKRRLDRLHNAAHNAGREPPWSPPHVYARLVEDAREDIARDARIGGRPLYRIDDGIIYATSDGRPIRHSGDYVGVLDEHIRELDAHIAECDAEMAECEARMTPEGLAVARREQEVREARLRGLTLDEEIAALGAEIAALNAEGGGG
jgi:hypothetical protein